MVKFALGVVDIIESLQVCSAWTEERGEIVSSRVKNNTLIASGSEGVQ
jgi:hypothetical protein